MSQATNLHYDDSHNCFVQIKGVKRFWMIPPSAFHNLYVFPKSHHQDRQSQVPWHPRTTNHAELVEQFPRFADVKRVWMAELHPGDTLVMPANWFHYVETVEAAIAVNTWTRSQLAVAWDRGIQ